jgi:hypothetical protein
MERSLKEIDSKLKEIAIELNASWVRDEDKGMWLPGGFEERSIEWSRDRIDYLIQIFPVMHSTDIIGWNFWCVASQDIKDARYWKQKNLVERGEKEFIINNIDALLKEGIAFLNGIEEKDMEFATTLNA